jgi:hypothetical protein
MLGNVLKANRSVKSPFKVVLRAILEGYIVNIDSHYLLYRGLFAIP